MLKEVSDKSDVRGVVPLREIRDGGLSPALSRLAERFTVPDLVRDTSAGIFILESPHVQELRHGAPVAGPSGATMTRHLFGEPYARLPLGRIVKKNFEEGLGRPSLDRVGILNVCPVPMQRTAYPNARAAEENREVFDALEGLRQANAKTEYGDAAWREAQEWILEDFRRRLRGLVDRPCAVVPCGRFAQKFFRLADVRSPHWTVVEGIPHPSYNSWDRAEYRFAIERLKAELKRVGIAVVESGPPNARPGE